MSSRACTDPSGSATGHLSQLMPRVAPLAAGTTAWSTVDFDVSHWFTALTLGPTGNGVARPGPRGRRAQAATSRAGPPLPLRCTLWPRTARLASGGSADSEQQSLLWPCARVCSHPSPWNRALANAFRTAAAASRLPTALTSQARWSSVAATLATLADVLQRAAEHGHCAACDAWMRLRAHVVLLRAIARHEAAAANSGVQRRPLSSDAVQRMAPRVLACFVDGSASAHVVVSHTSATGAPGSDVGPGAAGPSAVLEPSLASLPTLDLCIMVRSAHVTDTRAIGCTRARGRRYTDCLRVRWCVALSLVRRCTC